MIFVHEARKKPKSVAIFNLCTFFHTDYSIRTQWKLQELKQFKTASDLVRKKKQLLFIDAKVELFFFRWVKKSTALSSLWLKDINSQRPTVKLKRTILEILTSKYAFLMVTFLKLSSASGWLDTVYCVTPLLRYCVTVLHRYCVTALLCYCVTPLLRYCVTPLLCYCVTVFRYSLSL